MTLSLLWDDGHAGAVTLRTLRDACPCAGCQGETVLFKKSVPERGATEAPGQYELITAAPVGNYALKFSWADGHDQGIYTWELLRSLCQCAECVSRHPKQEDS